jgi:thioredoxin 1
MTIHINGVEEFKSKLLPFQGISVVDFWADRCGPCKMLAPIMDDLATLYSDNPAVQVVKINVDDNQELAGAFQVQSIPTIYIMRNGEVVDKMVGAQQLSVYQSKIDNLLTEGNK